MQQRMYRVSCIEAAQGLALSLQDVPPGSSVSDGIHSVLVTQQGAAVDISRWRHDSLVLAVPAEGDMPDSLRLLAVKMLDGKPVRRTYDLALLPLDVKEAPKPSLCLLGLPAGTRLGDGAHTLVSKAEDQRHEILGWKLDALTLRPPRGWHAQLALRVLVRGVSTEEIAELGSFQIRLVSPNAYLIGGEEDVAHHSLPVMNIVVEGVSSVVRPSVVVSSVMPNAWRDDDASDEELDDSALSALEKKLRLN